MGPSGACRVAVPRFDNMEHPANNIAPIDLARLAIESFIRDTRIVAPPVEPAGILALRAGVFVTLRVRRDELRGCIGTVAPECDTVAAEIIQNAIRAALTDPRFPAVTREELTYLRYGVDVLSPPEPIDDPGLLDPARYGVIVESIDGARRGLLLPSIAGIEKTADQWRAVHLKAGIRLGDPVHIMRFTVIRFGKDEPDSQDRSQPSD
jgi:AmmeMemoRadiSam system protein A